MANAVKTARRTPVPADGKNRSQIVFIGVGLVIVLGGLWLLYGVDGPYHPDVPMTDTLTQEISGS